MYKQKILLKIHLLLNILHGGIHKYMQSGLII